MEKERGKDLEEVAQMRDSFEDFSTMGGSQQLCAEKKNFFFENVRKISSVIDLCISERKQNQPCFHGLSEWI